MAAYEGLEDDAAVTEVSHRIKAREAVIHETMIARADALMAEGEWVLADELLKPLKTDPRALVRRAEMALTMNRLEGAGQWIKKFEAVEEWADEETMERAETARKRWENLMGIKGIVP